MILVEFCVPHTKPFPYYIGETLHTLHKMSHHISSEIKPLLVMRIQFYPCLTCTHGHSSMKAATVWFAIVVVINFITIDACMCMSLIIFNTGAEALILYILRLIWKQG